MENKEFNIAGKQVMITEQDCIFAYAFKILYDPISLSIDLYKKELLNKKRFDLNKVKQCLVNYYDKEEELDINEKSILTEVFDFMQNDYLEDRCEDIKDTFLLAVANIRDDFQENKNYDIKACDVALCIETTAEKLERDKYDYLVSINSPKVQGKKFEECRSWEYLEMDPYIIPVINRIRNVHADFLEEYFDFYPKDEDNLAVDVYNTIRYFSSVKNVEEWCKKLEEECVSIILEILSEIKEKYGIPFADKYIKSANYKKFVLSNDILLNNHKDCEKDPVDSLLSFPFLNKAYIPALQTIGDSDKKLESLANVLKVDIDEAKRYVYNKFLKEFNKVDMNNETEITRIYQKILDYKKFLGYEGIGNREQELKQKIDEFDIKYRTVNGILYETRQEADEIRSRSFEGKEYESKEQAELVRQEVEKIRSSCERNNILEKNRIFKALSLEKWETKEAIDELDKIKNAISAEYKEIKEKANMIEETKGKLKKRGLITGIIVVIMYACEVFLGNLALIVGIIVMGSTYKSLKNCEKSNELLRRFDTENGQDNSCKVNQDKTKKVCTVCGAEITDEMKYCVKCGAKLKEEK
nr:zinc-ribbon domain-containing protein [uncultured Blautia sp.]